MGRCKVVLKRIEDKITRQVTFSKRRSGLLKKSQELAVLCDIDVALLVFSATGRLSAFSTGDRMTEILARYERLNRTEESAGKNVQMNLASEQRDVGYADELTDMIQRHIEENRIKQLDINNLNQLQQHLASFLQVVRNRETQLRMGVLKSLKDKEMELKKERKLMIEEIEAARMINETTDDPGDAAQPQLPEW